MKMNQIKARESKSNRRIDPATNPFGHTCRWCGEACERIHIIVLWQGIRHQTAKHFCSAGCAAAWLSKPDAPPEPRSPWLNLNHH